MNAVSYARVSSEAQGDNSSIPSQLEANKIFAAKHSLTIISEKNDVASGATYEERSGLQEALAMVKNGKAQAVIIYSIDRGGRADSFLESFTRDIFSYGGHLGISQYNQLFDDYDDAFNQLFMPSKMAVWERAQIASRTNRGKTHHLEAGSWMWKPYFGYRVQRVGQINELVINEEEASIIRHAFNRLTQGYNQFETTAWINKTYGTNFTRTAISTWFKHRHIYAGKTFEKTYTINGRKGVYKRVAPRIIEDTTQLDGLHTRGRRPKNGAKPLTGRVRCTCGEMAVVVSTKTYDRPEYLRSYSYACRSLNRERANKGQNRAYVTSECRKSLTARKLLEALKHYITVDMTEKRRKKAEDIVWLRGLEAAAVQKLEKLEAELASFDERLTQMFLSNEFSSLAEGLNKKRSELVEEIELQKMDLEGHREDMTLEDIPILDEVATLEAIESHSWKRLSELLDGYVLEADFSTGEIIGLDFE